MQHIENYYQNIGIDCDFSEYQEQRKKELLYYLQKDNPDKAKVKELLRQIKN